MLRSLKSLERYDVSATDGDIGSVADFLLDDQRWVVRYLVVETGDLLERERELISPISFRKVDWSTRRFHVVLTVDAVSNSPSVDVDKPVSRQHERDYFRYYGYPYYWNAPGIWGTGIYPGSLGDVGRNETPTEQSDQPAGDVHLRSAGEIRGYHIQGSDDPIGHVADFIVDDETWAIRYLVIDMSNWWFGKKVLLAPQWAERVSWEERMVYVNVTRQAIKDGPEWKSSDDISREYEARLYDYYGRPVYKESAELPTIL